jgi:hypothetical protein
LLMDSFVCSATVYEALTMRHIQAWVLEAAQGEG